jgi:hypothetical protein
MSIKNNEIWGLAMLFHGQDIAAFTCLLHVKVFVKIDLHSQVVDEILF